MSSRIPILMYHEITPDPVPAFAKYSVTPRAFASQMRWLSRAGYTSVTLDALLASRCDGAALARRSVVITFDDGLKDSIEHAVPTLVSCGFTATFFIVAGLVGQTSRWLRPSLGLELPLADWLAVRSLHAAGMECGAHSMSHPRLADLPALAARGELVRAKALLEEQTGHEVRHLAYPYGSYDPAVLALAQEAGYHSACSVRQGLSGPADDQFALHRVPVLGGDSLLDFAWRLRTADGVRDYFRRKARGAWFRAVGQTRP